MGIGLICGALAACGDSAGSGHGSLTVAVEAEDTITDGIAAGDAVEDLRDGWSVSFRKYLVTIGDVELDFAGADALRASDEKVYVVDLKKVPQSGLPLWQLDDLKAGRWEFSYRISQATAGVERDDSVDGDDFQRMLDGGLTYLIEGEIDKPDGRSCPPVAVSDPSSAAEPAGDNGHGDDCFANPKIAFTLDVPARSRFSRCEIDGVPGVSVPSGGSQSVAMTIHGDHLFFNGFPSGSEGGVSRLAQWFADSDLNVDGMTTRQELEKIPPSALSDIDDRYQLGGSPLPLDAEATMWTYVIAQLETQGHLQGEGECQVEAGEPAN